MKIWTRITLPSSECEVQKNIGLMHMSIRVLDMFCGMSAFRSAAEKIGGFEFVGYCDNDPTAIVDRHGIMHKGRIRRLVPQECFRLMGFTDEQFFKLKNELGLADSKLYKLAGNSIMVPILVDILSRIKKINQKYSNLKEKK